MFYKSKVLKTHLILIGLLVTSIIMLAPIDAAYASCYRGTYCYKPRYHYYKTTIPKPRSNYYGKYSNRAYINGYGSRNYSKYWRHYTSVTPRPRGKFYRYKRRCRTCSTVSVYKYNKRKRRGY